MSVTSQSQHAFWNEPSISDSLIFLTADYVWGPSEGHVDGHRFIISAYRRRPSTMAISLNYDLEDRYMTIRRYEGFDPKVDILVSEKQEILARLRRVMSQRKAP
jgi:hypothetical protein